MIQASELERKPCNSVQTSARNPPRTPLHLPRGSRLEAPLPSFVLPLRVSVPELGNGRELQTRVDGLRTMDETLLMSVTWAVS